MKIVRNILGVIAGYLIFAVSAVVLFIVNGIDAHAEPTMGFMIAVMAYGVVFAFIGGYAAKLIATTRTMTANFVLASIMAGFAAFSLIMSTGNHYTQIAAIFLFAPMSLLGGFTRHRSEI
jgi:hypothetical protein